MAYATVAELRQYLEQAKTGDAADASLAEILERATAIVDGELGISFAEYDYLATEQDINSGNGGDFLYLPCHQLGSIEQVALLTARGMNTETETIITDYIEESRWRLFRAAGWLPRRWYRVAAIWGYGPAPADVVEVTLEVAVNIYRGREAGRWSEQLGAGDGGGTVYNRALTWAQKSLLANVRAQYP